MSGGGNLLLNVGPHGSGRIPDTAQTILRKVGIWLQRCGEAIFEGQRHDLPWLLAGQMTRHGHTIYVFLSPYEGPQTIIGGLTNRVLSVAILGADDVAFGQNGSQLFLHGLPRQAPNEVQTVVKIELDGPPDFDVSRVIGGADIFADLPV